MKKNLEPESKKGGIVGLIISSILIILVVPYTVIEYFDDSIPFSSDLFIISGISIVLFVINLYYFRSTRNQ